MKLCSRRDCTSASFASDSCLDHIGEAELVNAVERWHLGEPLDASGMTISSDSLKKLLLTLAREMAPGGTPLEPDRHACFPGAALFDNARFVGPADFTGVLFKGQASFDHATFEGAADFRRAEFCDHADFDNVTFRGPASFRGAIFNDHAGFQRAVFDSHDAGFISVKFRSYVDFEHARFDCDLKLTETTFQLARKLGPLDVAKCLDIDGCVFDERITVEALAGEVSATSTTFADGVRISVAKAALKMDCVDFGEVATLSRLNGSASLGESDPESRWSKGLGTPPRLMTLQRAQVASLSISGVELTDCRFFGAHGLESVVIEPSCRWRHTPRSRICIDRKMIVEEQEWREMRERILRAKRWLPQKLSVSWQRNASDSLGPVLGPARAPLEPAQLAALYRALRKASEDNNDQAGAGDLYYGEMEMRRLTSIPKGRGRLRAVADRAVIVAYWLLAGYGLRAWRSLGTLVIVSIAASVLLWKLGFREAESLRHASRVVVASATSLVRPIDDDELNGAGFGMEIFLRFTGPVLLALSALAIRSRIKR